MKIDHITAFIENADAAARVLSLLFGLEPVHSTELANMRIFTFRLGDVEIHINQPTGTGPVNDWFQKHGAGFHHVAVTVDNLEEMQKNLLEKGFSFLGQPVETAPGLREVFLDPKDTSGLMIQFVERKGTSEINKFSTSKIQELVMQIKSSS